MKKSILVLALGVILLPSCKKTWSCDCATTITTSNGTTVSRVVGSIPDQRRSDAETICKDTETQSNNSAALLNSITGNTSNTVCELQ